MPKRLSMLIRCQRNTTALYVVHGDLALFLLIG